MAILEPIKIPLAMPASGCGVVADAILLELTALDFDGPLVRARRGVLVMLQCL